MYITKNPYEWIRYIAYIFLTISFISMIWNRCNERNVNTFTWRSSFILGSSVAMVYSMLKLNHIRYCQPWILEERLFYELKISYILATICLWSVIAVGYWEQQKKTLRSMEIRHQFFCCIFLVLLGIDIVVFWQLKMETIEIQLVLYGAHQQISQLYEILFCCAIFTEGGYRKWKKRQ